MHRIYEKLGAPEVLVYLLQNKISCPLEILMQICKPIIYRSIHPLYIENYETEDLLQEGRLVLARAIEVYDFKSNLTFLEYYRMMLMNHFHHLIRRQEAQKRRANKNAYSIEELMETSGEHIQGLAKDEDHPESVTIIKEAYEAYISDLSDLEALVYIHYIENKSLREIAILLEADESQIQSALYRCKRKLDENLL